MATVKTVYDIKIITLSGSKRKEELQTVSVTGAEQKVAAAVDKKFKGKLFKKFFKGFQIDEKFIPFVAPKIYS